MTLRDIRVVPSLTNGRVITLGPSVLSSSRALAANVAVLDRWLDIPTRKSAKKCLTNSQNVITLGLIIPTSENSAN